MKEGLHLGAGIFVPIDEVEIRASRSSGPGERPENLRYRDDLTNSRV